MLSLYSHCRLQFLSALNNWHNKVKYHYYNRKPCVEIETEKFQDLHKMTEMCFCIHDYNEIVTGGLFLSKLSVMGLI